MSANHKNDQLDMQLRGIIEASGLTSPRTFADMEVPSAEEKEVSLAQEEFSHLMTYVRNSSVADLMQVTWESGCRP